MANQAKGERTLKIGEKTYTVFFDMNAIAELEDALGMTMPQIAEVMQDPTRVGVKFIRAILWAGLRRHHSKEVQTLEDAGDLMTKADSIADVSETIGEAFSAAFAKDAERAGRQKKRTK